MDWEDKFRRLRKASDEETPAFLDTVSVESSMPVEDTPAPEINNTQEQKSTTSLSEKAEMLDGLKKLASNELKETGSPIKFSGGEVSLTKKNSELDKSSELVAADADISPVELDVLFVYNYSSDALELPEDQRHEAPSEQLLQRMIKAMKMPDDKYESLRITEDGKALFLTKMASLKVKIIVPMGAVATNLILGKEERISKVHGKFFTRELVYQNSQVREFQVVPVFNPEMILINPNMKRSTWLDLQRIMEKLGIKIN